MILNVLFVEIKLIVVLKYIIHDLHSIFRTPRILCEIVTRRIDAVSGRRASRADAVFVEAGAVALVGVERGRAEARVIGPGAGCRHKICRNIYTIHDTWILSEVWDRDSSRFYIELCFIHYTIKRG